MHKTARYKMIVAILLCVYCTLQIFFCIVKAEEDTKETKDQEQISKTNVLLLFDKSGSMGKKQDSNEQISGEELGYGQEAIKWAQDICAIITDSDITFCAEAFDTTCKTIVEPQIISTKDAKINNIFESFTYINFKGFTNQYEAIKKAKERLEKETGSKYIIMLSDGELDLVDSKTETKEERDAKCNFRKECISLANEEDYTIILIGLGKKLELYSGLDEKSNNIICYNNQKDLDKLKTLLLSDVGFKVESLNIEESVFTIDKDYDICIVRLNYYKKKFNHSSMDFDLFYHTDEKNRKRLEADEIISTPMTTYLYLRNPSRGKYEARFSEGTIKVDYIKKERIGKVTLKLLDKDGKEYEHTENNNRIQYDLKQKYQENDNNSLSKLLNFSVYINVDLPSRAEATIYWKEVDCLQEEYAWDSASADGMKVLKTYIDSDKAWKEQLKLAPGKEYECFVVVNNPEVKEKCISNKIYFSIPESSPTPIPTPISYVIQGKVNEVIPYEKYIQLSDLADNKRISIILDDNILVKDGIIETKLDQIQIDEALGLNFKKNKEYVIHVKDGDVERIVINFIIRKNYKKYIICLFLLFVVIFLILKNKKVN